jgi:cell wall-associated NlpC family hydrolase|tara:strand:- start:4 stop:1137 length:1134 start_codon:yes stop_codon:yes gene_type:complete
MRKFYIFIFLFFAISCTNKNIEELVVKKITSLSEKHAPDPRIAIWNIDIDYSKNPIQLIGETDLRLAKKEFLQYLISEEILFKDNITVYPNYEITDGIINNSVANLRKNPSHSSELVSQVILGTGVKILTKKEEWYLVQTPDNYISWVDHGGIFPMSEENYNDYFSSDIVYYTKPYGFSYETKDKIRVVSDLVLGSALKVIENSSKLSKVEYPDGRKGWVESSLLNSISELRDMNYSIKNLLKNAHSLIGVPYLWGGTSSKGFDCSGYTKSVYLMNGYILPRDASQQIREGVLVDDKKDWSNLQVGDLMFFGYYKGEKRRIDHVAIWLGDGYFIQASKNVRINSVYSDRSNYDKYHMEKYIESRRIFGNITLGIKEL